MSFATTSTQTLQQLLADASRCAECQQPAEHTDAEGFCGGCLDSRTCPCVTERSELADARRDDDRAAFDASVAA